MRTTTHKSSKTNNTTGNAEHNSTLAAVIGLGSVGAAMAGIVGAMVGVIIGVPIGYFADRETEKNNHASSDNK